MKNFIKKINFFHSIIFFLIATLFSVILDQYQDLTISPVICLILIISIGISHGSLDNIKGKKLLNFYKIKNMTIFYFFYILIALIVVLLWMIIPTISLILFLFIASYHFGKEDTEFLVTKSKINLLLYFFKGFLIIIAPLTFHFVETINIFKLLLVDNEVFYNFLAFIENNNLLSIIFLICMLSYIYFFSRKFKIVNFLLFFDFFSIIILNYFLSPLIAFTIYFCFLHSFRHSISLAIELDNSNFKNGCIKFFNKAMPLTILTAILYLITLYILANFFEINDAILKVIFIGLASLTFPHILLEYIIEKNEK